MSIDNSIRIAEYQRNLINAMNEHTIPALTKLDTNELLRLSFQLSFLSPIVNNMEHTRENLEIHRLVGMGCAALQLLAITQLDQTTQNIINAKD